MFSKNVCKKINIYLFKGSTVSALLHIRVKREEAQCAFKLVRDEGQSILGWAPGYSQEFPTDKNGHYYDRHRAKEVLL